MHVLVKLQDGKLHRMVVVELDYPTLRMLVRDPETDLQWWISDEGWYVDINQVFPVECTVKGGTFPLPNGIYEYLRTISRLSKKGPLPVYTQPRVITS